MHHLWHNALLVKSSSNVYCETNSLYTSDINVALVYGQNSPSDEFFINGIWSLKQWYQWSKKTDGDTKQGLGV